MMENPDDVGFKGADVPVGAALLAADSDALARSPSNESRSASRAGRGSLDGPAMGDAGSGISHGAKGRGVGLDSSMMGVDLSSLGCGLGVVFVGVACCDCSDAGWATPLPLAEADRG